MEEECHEQGIRSLYKSLMAVWIYSLNRSCFVFIWVLLHCIASRKTLDVDLSAQLKEHDAEGWEAVLHRKHISQAISASVIC